MKVFDELIEVADRLNGPKGCPWDVKQTFASLRSHVLEEAHEIIDAVDANDHEGLMEELGDLFYIMIFYSKIAEKTDCFTLEQMIDAVREKLIRRHPHVFGDESAETPEDVVKTWNRVKKKEKKDRKSAFDGIPNSLPSLQRAQKVLKNRGGSFPEMKEGETKEDTFSFEILKIIERAHQENIDMESALRKTLTTLVLSSEN